MVDAIQTGIDLTFCSNILVAELSFKPYVMAQSIKRFHRFGQLLPVNVTLFVVNGSLDERIADILCSKITAISAVVGAGTETQVSKALDNGDETVLLQSLTAKLAAEEASAIEIL